MADIERQVAKHWFSLYKTHGPNKSVEPENKAANEIAEMVMKTIGKANEYIAIMGIYSIISSE